MPVTAVAKQYWISYIKPMLKPTRVPAEIGDGFKELEEFLHTLPLADNNAVFNLCCRLCSAYERKAFRDGILYGAHLISEIKSASVKGF